MWVFTGNTSSNFAYYYSNIDSLQSKMHHKIIYHLFILQEMSLIRMLTLHICVSVSDSGGSCDGMESYQNRTNYSETSLFSFSVSRWTRWVKLSLWMLVFWKGLCICATQWVWEMSTLCAVQEGEWGEKKQTQFVSICTLCVIILVIFI